MKPLVPICVCGAALLDGPMCLSCGYDNSYTALLPSDPSLREWARQEEQKVLRSASPKSDARGRKALPPNQSPEHDDYSEESEL